MLNHIWDKHSLDSGLTHVCEISLSQSSFLNLQSFRKHVSKKHISFFNNNMKVCNKNPDCEVIPDRNAVRLESFVNDDEKYEELDYIFLIS